MRLVGKLGLAALVALAAGAILAPGPKAQSKPTATKTPSKSATQTKSGSASKSTATKTGAKKASTKRRSTARRQTAPTNERIREIQAALIRAGHLAGEPNGKWDDKSVAAMKGFQEANGLKVTGKFDAASLQKLGLGSQTAGVAAPRPLAAAGETGSRQR